MDNSLGGIGGAELEPDRRRSHGSSVRVLRPVRDHARAGRKPVGTPLGDSARSVAQPRVARVLTLPTDRDRITPGHERCTGTGGFRPDVAVGAAASWRDGARDAAAAADVAAGAAARAPGSSGGHTGAWSAARSAVLASGDSYAVASHLTAAAFHAIAVPCAGGGGHVTVPEPADAGRVLGVVDGLGLPGDVTMHVAALPDVDVVADDEVAVTTPERTLLDLTSLLPRLDAVWAIDDALRRGLADDGTLHRCLRRRETAVVDDSARKRLAESDGTARSMLETAARLALRDGGVPLPVPHYRINDGSGHVATVDAAYPQHRIALQLRPPSTADAADPAARTRRCRLSAMGWTVLRFSWWDVRYAAADFVHQVRSTLTAAA